MIEPLASSAEAVGDFDARDREHYVYTVIDPGERAKWQAERHAPSIVGTGRNLPQLLFPDDPRSASSESHRFLWAVVAGKHFEVKHNVAPIVVDGTFCIVTRWQLNSHSATGSRGPCVMGDTLRAAVCI